MMSRIEGGFGKSEQKGRTLLVSVNGISFTACTAVRCDILEVKNSLVRTLHYARKHTFCSLILACIDVEQKSCSWNVCETIPKAIPTFWYAYVLGGAYFVWPWKSRVPHRDIVTSQRRHWPLLIRVSGITWRGSKLLKASRNIKFGTRYVCTCVGAGSGMGGRTRKTHVLLLCVSVIFFNVCHVYV
jgi:hypothetical protein